MYFSFLGQVSRQKNQVKGNFNLMIKQYSKSFSEPIINKITLHNHKERENGEGMNDIKVKKKKNDLLAILW